MSSSNPPPAPSPRDSEPGPDLSLPPDGSTDMAFWDEADMRVLRGPSPTFADAPPASAEPAPTIGHIGRYALKHRLGEGGLGTVYAAHDPLLSRLIAVKTLNVEIVEAERASFNAMFLNEARAAGGLNHSHIVTVFDAGISDNRAYIAMELLKGRDLRQLRQEGWRATPVQAALIVRRVADALGYAHSKGVIHRDVKPANIFMIGRTQPKVLDFGIARVTHRHDAGTGSDVAAGSPYYMAPEQARQETTVDRRADVFSLGVVLYELLTDLKPFRGATLDEITEAVLTHEPPLANVIEPAVPVALAEIVAKAIAKDPEHRYRSARALSRELRHWLDENSHSLDGEPVIDTARPRRVWIAAAALGVLLVGGLVWSLLTPHRGRSAPALAAAPAAPAVAPATAAAASMAATVAAVPVPVPASAAAAPIEMPAATANAPVPAPLAPAAIAVAPTVNVAAPAPKTASVSPPKPAKESTRERRAREARERDARIAAAAAAAPAATGVVRIAISPWGEIEVDGKPAGTSPPLTELSLSAGRHQIVVRNTDLPAHTVVLNVTADQPVTLKHKF